MICGHCVCKITTRWIYVAGVPDAEQASVWNAGASPTARGRSPALTLRVNDDELLRIAADVLGVSEALSWPALEALVNHAEP